MARTALIGLLIAAALAGLAPSSAAPIAQAITLTLKDHRFSPSEIRVAAGHRASSMGTFTPFSRATSSARS